MQYPLPEKIGDPTLLVGREQAFRNFRKWINFIPRRIGKSRVILARRKSGKTAFIQRLFNQLWSENGAVIPFYFDIADRNVWLQELALKYYEAFASQYISFLERDADLVRQPLSLEEVREYGLANGHKLLVSDVNRLLQYKQEGHAQGLMWDLAVHAPHRYATVLDIRFLVLLDEFQNLAGYVYRDEACERALDETIPGSYHSLSESKYAPMLVTGSYVGWLLKIMGKHLEGGRLSIVKFSPYLTPEEGLQAVYKYAEVFDEPITNETALQINELCMADPFFISCVTQSAYPNRDLTTREGVIEVVNYEIADREAEMSTTWAEYIELTLQRINDHHAKTLLLHLSKHADRYWSTYELKEELDLPLSPDEIKRKLLLMVESDVIEWGTSDIQFRGLQDGTLNLILRHRFEEEIAESQPPPDLRPGFQAQLTQLEADKRRLQGMLNHVTGQFAEHQLANEFRSRKRFALPVFFEGAEDTTPLNILDVRERVFFQRSDGKRMEIDVLAEARDGRVVLVEVRKRQKKTGVPDVEDFSEKVEIYRQQFPEKTVLPAFLSLGGFTEDARRFCEQEGIGRAERIVWGS